jgi:2-amino-4-hydroxy-6-hydroxymethyldihydropteridine diphosphokinase
MNSDFLLLSLGSNVGDREFYLKAAVEDLSLELGPVIKSSSITETMPEGVDSHPAYLNWILAFATSFEATEIHAITRKIEDRYGRTDKGLLQPRTLDIDILAIGNQLYNSDTLTIPHKSLHLRKFILEPLRDFFPEWRHPSLNMVAEEMLVLL